MCAVQHEPPRVPLTALPNPLLTPESSSAGMGHPGMGQPSVPAAALLLGCCRASRTHLRLWGDPRHGRSRTGSCPCCQDAACSGLAAAGHQEVLIPSWLPSHRPGHIWICSFRKFLRV